METVYLQLLTLHMCVQKLIKYIEKTKIRALSMKRINRQKEPYIRNDFKEERKMQEN